ncbi:glycosyltransferase family 4 protein [Azospirillum sp.]|uniref:glycosyltransferase family 4 protein n=1 Tax=Azospirillum sp. TaxID=34012 RepID=UPI00262F9DB0|nr:glycosyltransferase family 4 protein [Azospirillum sp.]
MSRPVRLAYLVSHPIHYQVPLLRRLAADPDIDLTVFFQSDLTVRGGFDPTYGTEIHWDVDLLSGYRYEFLPANGPLDVIDFWNPRTHGLWSRLREGRFDALWIHGYARFYHLKAMAMARLTGIPVLVRDEATAISRRRGPVRRLFKRAFFLILSRLVRSFLTIGCRNAAYYRQCGIPDDRLIGMPYAVDNDYFRTAADAARPQLPTLRATLGLDRDSPVILYASRLEGRKHADDLLAAYRRLVESGQTHRPYLLFVGEGELRLWLETEIARLGLDRVRLLGFRGQQELPALFALADVFVLPAVHEPWGMVINEAMNAGTTVVACDQVGCTADLIEDGVTGCLVAARDVDGLAATLLRLLADPEARRRIGAAGRDRISRFSYAEDVRGLRLALGLDATIGLDRVTG